jgi:hypothetical protein
MRPAAIDVFERDQSAISNFTFDESGLSAAAFFLLPG